MTRFVGSRIRIVRDHDDGLVEIVDALRRNPRTSELLVESRFPVGSSANTNLWRLANARAHATRCCWPPDSSVGFVG